MKWNQNVCCMDALCSSLCVASGGFILLIALHLADELCAIFQYINGDFTSFQVNFLQQALKRHVIHTRLKYFKP